MDADTVSVVSLANDSPLTKRLVSLLPHPYDPCRYSNSVRTVLQPDKNVTEISWKEAAAVPCLGLDQSEKPVKRCAVQGGQGWVLYMAHVVPKRTQARQFEALIRAGAVPSWAHHDLPANKFPLCATQHNALDKLEMHFLPDTSSLLARLACAVVHAYNRAQADAAARPPFHPSVDDFYAKLEAEAAIARPVYSYTCTFHSFNYIDTVTAETTLYSTGRDRYEVLPARSLMPIATVPIRLPCSMNLLVYAMAGRLALDNPAPQEVQKATQNANELCRFLKSIWHMREGDDDELRQLIEHLKIFVQDNFPASPFSNFICHPEQTSFAQILAVNSPTPLILEEGDELSWAEAGDEEIWQPVQQTEEERAAKVAAWQQAQVTPAAAP